MTKKRYNRECSLIVSKFMFMVAVAGLVFMAMEWRNPGASAEVVTFSFQDISPSSVCTGTSTGSQTADANAAPNGTLMYAGSELKAWNHLKWGVYPASATAIGDDMFTVPYLSEMYIRSITLRLDARYFVTNPFTSSKPLIYARFFDVEGNADCPSFEQGALIGQTPVTTWTGSVNQEFVMDISALNLNYNLPGGHRIRVELWVYFESRADTPMFRVYYGQISKNTMLSIVQDAVSSNVTTVGPGDDVLDTAVAPGGPIVDLDAFTLQTSSGTDSVERVAVTLSPSGSYAAVSTASITSDDGGTVYGSISGPSSDVMSIALTTPISISSSPAPYKVRISPKSHEAMPAASYNIRGLVTGIGSLNQKIYNDSSNADVSTDNMPPGTPVWGTILPGDEQIMLSWIKPADGDFSEVLVLRRWFNPVTDSPAEGVSYIQGGTLGSSTVAYVGNLEGFIDTGLLNSYWNYYYYRIFAKDSYGNYSAPGSDAGPYMPGASITVGNGADPFNTMIAPGGPAAMLDSFTLQSLKTAATVTNVTVSLGAGTAAALSKIEVTNDSGATVYGTVTNPGSDIVSIPLSTHIVATGTAMQYKVRVTPKAYIYIPAGSVYLVTGTVSSLAVDESINHFTMIFNDSSSATITVDSNSSGKAYNISVDAVSATNSPLYTISPGTGFKVRAKAIDQSAGTGITGLTNADVVISKITNMTNNIQLTAGTNYGISSFTEMGGGVYDLGLTLNSGIVGGDILQLEVRATTGAFVDAQWMSATQYVKVSASGSASDARYVEIQPSTAGDITALTNAAGSYNFKIKFIDASGAAYNPGSLVWAVDVVKDNAGSVPAGTYTVSAAWNAGGWYDCVMNMSGATLLAGNRYYVVFRASTGNYIFRQSMGLSARTLQTTPKITVPSFTDPSLDITPPAEGTLSVVNDSGTGYVLSGMTVRETFSDSESAVASCEYTLDGNTWSTFTSVSGALPNFTCSTLNTGAQADGSTVVIKMRATSAGGTSSPVNTLTRTVDAVAPVDGTVTVTPGYKVNVLNWTSATDARSGLDVTNTYVVYANVGGGIPADCSTGAMVYQGPATTFIHTGLMSGWNYGYRICAYDKVHNRSAGATGSGTTFIDTTGPVEASGTLIVSPDTGTYIAGTYSLTEDFSDPHTPVSSCKYSKNNGTNWYPANTVTDLGSGNYRCTASNLTGTNGQSVTLMMKATSDGGESVPSASLARTVDAAAPVDGLFTATPGDRANLLSWTTAVDSVSGLAPDAYKVVYRTGSTPPADCNSGALLYSGADLAYSHTNLVNLTTYSYRVCAIDNMDNISAGVTASARPGDPVTKAGTAVAIPFLSGLSSGINVLMPYSDDSNDNNTYTLDYKLSTDTAWGNLGDFPHAASPFQTTIGLAPGQTYDLRVTYRDTDGVTGSAVQVISNIRIPSERLVHNSMNANKKNYWPEYGGWGLPGTQYGEFTCATCHEPRAWNIAGIKGFINLMPVPGPTMHFGGPVNFQSKTGPDGFGDDGILRDPPPPVSKICEVCHTQTYGRTGPDPAPFSQLHRYNQTETSNHADANNTNCTWCHTHNAGFKAPW